MPRDLHEYLTKLIKEAAASYLTQEKLEIGVEQLPIKLDFSAQASFGDYSMPVMAWASKKLLGRPPVAIAEGLANILREMQNPIIEEITVTKPGYLNFRLNRPVAGQSIIER